MQNNVKRSLLAGIISFTLFIALLVAYFLMQDAPTPVTNVPDGENTNANVFESDGVTYVGDGFEISEYTHAVKKGETAKITASSEKKAKLEISVYYASGKSTSSVFSPKTVDKDASVEWKWTVPSNTSASKIRVVIRSGDTYATLYIDLI